jgi:hypothetical protein
MVTMLRWLRLVVLGAVLAGCASNAPPASDATCCAASAPGTMKFHVGGAVVTGVGVSR